MTNNRRVLIGLLALLVLPFFSSAQSAQPSCPSLSRNLSSGSRGADVIQLQDFLIAQNLLPQGDNTGYFGRLTKTAAVQFQTQRGLPTTGFVGPLTRAAIAKVCRGKQTTVSDLNTNTKTSNASGSAISLTSIGPAQGFIGDSFEFDGTGRLPGGKSYKGTIDVYFGNVLEAAVGTSNGCSSSPDCVIIIGLADVPQLPPGTYRVTIVSSGVTSNSLNFTVESGMPASCPVPPPIQCISGYKFAWDGSNDGKSCSQRLSCVPIATSTFQI
jgi:Putative peptidoglycan binding domain